MKQNLSVFLALVCIVLVISFILVKRNDNVQHENDAGTIADYSNRLDSAHMDVVFGKATILTLSNNLAESQSASLTFSNQLTEAQSTIALNTEQITNLNRKVEEMESENQTLSQTLDRRVMELTNQVAGLTKQIALTEGNLNQANQDYALLENRLRRDVAERVVVARKFNNLVELQTQMEKLKKNPTGEVSAEDIYTGLDLEVTTNGFHVLSRD